MEGMTSQSTLTEDGIGPTFEMRLSDILCHGKQVHTVDRRYRFITRANPVIMTASGTMP